MKNVMKYVASMAWMLVKKYSFTFSEAMKKAWAIVKLKTAMYRGNAIFAYKKIDGTIRFADGTLSHEVVPVTNEGGKKANDTLVTYWDNEAHGWRSFKIANYIGLV